MDKKTVISALSRSVISKQLYLDNPVADLVLVFENQLYYESFLKDGTVIYFKIPFEETKGARFLPKMESKYLRRWLK